MTRSPGLKETQSTLYLHPSAGAQSGSYLATEGHFFGRRKPTPPSQCDQVTACLTDRAYQCAAQTAAAINNIFLLTYSISSITTQPSALPAELATEIGKSTGAILTLFTTTAVVQAHIKACTTMLKRNIWLHMSQLPEQIRKGLLEDPISPDRLFGPLLPDAINHLQQASEEAEKVHKHTSWSRASSHQQGSWQDRRDFQLTVRRPTTTAVAASRPALPQRTQPLPLPPATATAQSAPRSPSLKSIQLACTWSNPPNEPPCKQQQQ